METRDVDLTGLSFEQLEGLKKQTESDIKNLGFNLQQMRVAQSKFMDSAACIASLPEGGAGRDILVPLTSNLFVPGIIAEKDEVLVDVGTGFYVGKSSKDAALIMAKKSDMVKGKADELTRMISIKQSNLEIIENNLQLRAMQMRAMEEAAARAGGAGATAGAVGTA